MAKDVLTSEIAPVPLLSSQTHVLPIVVVSGGGFGDLLGKNEE